MRWIVDVVDVHVRAWSALASAVADVVGLPLKTAQLFGLTAAEPDSPPVAKPEEVAALKGAYARLEHEAAQRATQAETDQKLALYARLEPLLLQLPAVRHAIAQGRDVTASDLLDLLGPLDDALSALGFAAIGTVGEIVPYEPALHQAPQVNPGEMIAIRTPGQRLGARVLRRAKAARA